MENILNNFEEEKFYNIKFIKSYRNRTPIFDTEKLKLIQKTDRLLIFKRQNEANLCISLNDLLDESAKISARKS